MSITPTIYAITDPKYYNTTEELLNIIRSFIKQGIKYIQYRDKNIEPTLYFERAQKIQQICRQHSVHFFINDHIEIAVALESNLHIGQTDLLQFSEQQRQKINMLGITCHNDITLAIKAQQFNPSYISVGRFFSSQTKPNAKSAKIEDIETFRKLPNRLCLIGGINFENIKTLPYITSDLIAMCACLHDNLCKTHKID